MHGPGPPASLSASRHGLVADHLEGAIRHGHLLARDMLPADEVAGVCGLAAVEAAARWDEGRGLPFAPYLRLYVRRHVLAAVHASHALRIPVSFWQAGRRRTDGLAPAIAENRRAKRVAGRRAWRARSLDAPDPATGRPRSELLPAGESPAAADPDDLAALGGHLARLSAHEREVVALRYGLDGGPVRTLREVGEVRGYGPARAWNVHARALGKLRAMFRVEDVAVGSHRRPAS